MQQIFLSDIILYLRRVMIDRNKMRNNLMNTYYIFFFFEVLTKHSSAYTKWLLISSSATKIHIRRQKDVSLL